MQEDFIPWYAQFWSNHLYRILLIIIVLETTSVVCQVFWILHQSRMQRRKEAELNNARKTLQPFFLRAMIDPSAVDEFNAKARSFKEATLIEFILPYLSSTSGDYLERVRGAYKTLGLLEKDIKDLHSVMWHIRLMALRHLVMAGGREALFEVMGMRKDRHVIRVLAASVVARYGKPEQLMQFLVEMEPSKRIMEQPLFTLIKGLDPDKIDFLIFHLDEFVVPAMRRILLSCYAQVVPQKAVALLPTLAEDSSKEVRIGACIAAGDLATGRLETWLLKMLEDPEWEVRAQAAKALGRFKNPEVIPALEKALCDGSFWVRQNAAAAMSLIGDEGIMALRDLAAGCPDKYAADAAIQELRRNELFVRARA